MAYSSMDKVLEQFCISNWLAAQNALDEGGTNCTDAIHCTHVPTACNVTVEEGSAYALARNDFTLTLLGDKKDSILTLTDKIA